LIIAEGEEERGERGKLSHTTYRLTWKRNANDIKRNRRQAQQFPNKKSKERLLQKKYEVQFHKIVPLISPEHLE
jgi:hypothetical protein